MREHKPALLAYTGRYGNPDHEVLDEHRQDPDIWPIWSPSDLASRLREASEQVGSRTLANEN